MRRTYLAGEVNLNGLNANVLGTGCHDSNDELPDYQTGYGKTRNWMVRVGIEKVNIGAKNSRKDRDRGL